MSVPEIIKTALPINAAASTESAASVVGVSTPKPVKNEPQATPLRMRNQSNIFPNTPGSANFEKSEVSSFFNKGKNPPKPPEEFYKDLQQFHERRRTPIMQVPKINGRPIDLHKLYSEVVERGGFLKVNGRDEWDEVLAELQCVRDKCVNATAAIKIIYRRCLDKYERLNFFGEDPDKMEALEASLIDAPEIGGRSRSRYPMGIMHSSSGSMNTVPMSYNYRQHHVNMDRRRQYKLSTDLHKHSPYEKLMLSLMSPLPNEQDFAINVCTLMTNEPKHTLKLNEFPKLLDILLAHAGVFPDYTMRKLFQHIYTEIRQHSLYGFWRDLLISKPQILELYTDEQDLRDTGLLDEDDLMDKHKNEDIEECAELDFFNLGRGEGTQDYVGQRVQQIVQILRNLSFFDENTLALAKNRTFLRFVVMCANIRWGNVHVQALEMAGNIASDIDLSDPTIDDLSRSFMGTLCDGIEGMDRGVIINCLEILYKVCSREGNEDYINRCLSFEFYKKICLYLSLNDIMLLIFTLEAIYALTSMGARSCSLIMQVRGVVDQLMALITVEAQSYGPDGCILMRVVETVPGNMLPMVAQNIANLQNVAVAQKPAILTPPSQQSLQVIEQPQHPVHVVSGEQKPPHLQQHSAIANTAAPAAVAHAQSFTQEDEQYALSWLGATFERAASMESHIEQNELYRMYLAHCQRSGKHSVVNHVAFPRLVRLVFNPTVGPVTVRRSDGIELPGLHYVAIRVRAQPLPIQGGKSGSAPPISPKGDALMAARKLKKKPLPQTSNQLAAAKPQQEQTSVTGTAVVNQTLIKTEATQSGEVISSNSNQSLIDNKLPVKTEAPKLMKQLSNTTETPMDIDEDITTKVKTETTIKTEEVPPVAQNTQQVMHATATTTVKSHVGSTDISTSAVAPSPTITSAAAPTITNTTTTTQQSHPTSTSLIKSLLANKVNQRQQKQKELATTSSTSTLTQAAQTTTVLTSTGTISHAQQQQQPLKVASNAISALVNSPLMQNTSLKVGQTTIKPLHPQVSLDKKPMIIDSAPPPLAPLSGSNVVVTKDSSTSSSRSSLIISNQVVLDSQSGTIIKRRNTEEQNLSQTPKRILLEVEQQAEEEETIVTPSKNAANLYAEMAASILEDEDLDDIPPLATTSSQSSITTTPTIEPPPQQQQPQAPTLMMSTPIQQQQQQQQPQQLQNVQRQLVFQTNSPAQANTQLKLATSNNQQQLPTAMATIKTDQGLQTVPVILQQKAMEQSQIIHQAFQQQQPQQTQYVLATNPQGQTYLVAQQAPQQQTIQQQPTQTVLVTQTPQQQSTGTKTIIILQQQAMPNTNQSHGQQQIITTGQCGPQKMIMTTAQGQQVLVTQRPQTPQQQFFINPQTGQATHIQHVSVPVSTVGGTGVIQRQIIQTTAGAQQQQQQQLQHPQHQQLQLQQTATGQMSPSLLSQLNQIPATIKLHQPQQQQYQQNVGVITQTPQQQTQRLVGKQLAIAQKPTQTTTTTIVPPLQQHQSIIQQHIVSGPVVEKQQSQQPQQQQQRQVILSRAIDIKETVISQAQPAPQQSQLNSQTIITTQPVPAASPVVQSQPQVRAVIEQHPSIIQQKITVPIQQPQQAVQSLVAVGAANTTTTVSKNEPPSSKVQASPSVVKKLPMAPAKPAQPQPAQQPQTQTTMNTSNAATKESASGTNSNAANQQQQQKQAESNQSKAENASSSGTTSTANNTASVSTNAAGTSQTQQPPPAAQPPAPAQPTQPAIDVNWLYICDWRNCPRRKFKSLSDLQHHACVVHCPDHLDPAAEIFCQWGPGPGLCDNIPRKRYSLMTHLMDRHLTTESMRAAVQRRIATGAHNIQPSQPPVTIVRNIEQAQRVSTASPALSTSSSTSSSTQPSTTAGSSAIQAIKRHTADFVNPKELMDENEGPVTKSIRLTSALILRNLVTYTNTAKRALRRYEPQLANVALSNVESSSAISHILFELNN